METVHHTFPPFYSADSRVLLLGSMPSPKSRENGFYYGHPQNRFWKVLAAVLKKELPVSNQEKMNFLTESRIALWDVLASCDIEGADDGSIRNPVPNDIGKVLREADIQAVFTTGGAAQRYYRKFCLPQTKVEAIALPSTSPANCRHYDLEKLIMAYQVIRRYISL